MYDIFKGIDIFGFGTRVFFNLFHRKFKLIEIIKLKYQILKIIKFIFY